MASSYSLIGRTCAAYHCGAADISPSSWRTRDINGDQFRQSKSSSLSSSSLVSVPPRDIIAAKKYAEHLPFQVFCCESGTHVVDPAQSYYAGLAYRAGTDFHNASTPADVPHRGPDAKCLDSTQAWFCRDLWVHKAREAMRDVEPELRAGAVGVNPRKRQLVEVIEPAVVVDEPRQGQKEDSDANVGSDYDASDLPLENPPPADDTLTTLTIPNSAFSVARILVNPRCVTTYAGVSHTQLALDLFGPPDREDREDRSGRDILDDWEGAPDTFVCQEQQ